MTTKNFVVFDADSHVVEPPTLWEKYLDAEYRTLGKHALWVGRGSWFGRCCAVVGGDDMRPIWARRRDAAAFHLGTPRD